MKRKSDKAIVKRKYGISSISEQLIKNLIIFL